MSSIFSQMQTFSNMCDLIDTAGSDSKVHVVDNKRFTQAERGMSPANDKMRIVYAYGESGLDTGMLTDEVNRIMWPWPPKRPCSLTRQT